MTTSFAPAVDIRRARSRFHTKMSWLDSNHSFSFGHHYDPKNTGFGLLLVNNDDIVAAATGFETHPHRDMEIVTWVLSGSLVHQDSMGNRGLITPGLAQRMSAGTGILHSEKNDAFTDSSVRLITAVEPVHFLQMWVLPDEGGITPGYEQLDISEDVARGGLHVIASGRPAHRQVRAISIHQRDAALHVAQLGATVPSVELPDAPWLHLHVAKGNVLLEDSLFEDAQLEDNAGALGLEQGDTVRITGGGGRRLSLAPSSGAAEQATVMVWEMHSNVMA